MSNHNNKMVVNRMQAVAFALVLFILLVIILRAGTGII
jgi:hypothetical protein